MIGDMVDLAILKKLVYGATRGLLATMHTTIRAVNKLSTRDAKYDLTSAYTSFLTLEQLNLTSGTICLINRTKL